MNPEPQTERTARFRHLFATVADDAFRQRHGQIRSMIRGGADIADQLFYFPWVWTYARCTRIYRNHSPRWSYYNPWSPQNQELRHAKRTDRLLRKLCYRPRSSIRNCFRLVRVPAAKRTAKINVNGTIFAKLPPELRQKILIEAFGNQIIHIDLSLRHPFQTMSEEEYQLRSASNVSYAHAKICRASLQTFSVYDTTKERQWSWFACVCHRHKAEAPHIRFGQRANSPFERYSEPEADQCLIGRGKCAEWPGKWPSKCLIGIYGWLLSCHQAYIEGCEILFKMNTFHISSPILICGIQDILSPKILSMMTSVEIVLDRNQVDLDRAFTTLPARFGIKSSTTRRGKPIFPSLRQLRLSVRTKSFQQDPWTLQRRLQSNTSLYDIELSRSLLLELDGLVERIVPATTDVVFSCPSWNRYTQFENELLAAQGSEKTQCQMAELGGIKCWREIPGEESGSRASIESSSDGLLNEPLRSGYWIHTSRMR